MNNTILHASFEPQKTTNIPDISSTVNISVLHFEYFHPYATHLPVKIKSIIQLDILVTRLVVCLL
jgi:hypothetical protein